MTRSVNFLALGHWRLCATFSTGQGGMAASGAGVVGWGGRGPGGCGGVPRLGGVELDVHGEQAGAEHAHADRVQCAQRCQAMMCRWRASGSSSGQMVATPGTQR